MFNNRIIIILAFLLTSCEDEFNPNIVAEPIPIVYGIIDPDDSLYSIRLTKSFVCAEDFSFCAKDPMVQYFIDPIVEFELLNENQQLLHRSLLRPMRFNQKEDGLFSVEPNIHFGIKKSDFYFENDDSHMTNSTTKYLVLKIESTETSNLTFAMVKVRHPPDIVSPSDRFEREFQLFGQLRERVTWVGYTDDYHFVSMRVCYANHFTGATVADNFSITFQIKPPRNPETPESQFEYFIEGEIFLQKMAKWFRTITEPASLKYRKISSLEIIVNSISPDFSNYVASINHDSDFDIGETSNIVNGTGVFAVKRTSISAGHSFHPEVMDSIANSVATKHLKFVKW